MMKKKIIVITVAVFCVALIALCTVIHFTKENENPEIENKSEIMLSNDIRINDFTPYTGNFIEDSSDSEVENVAAVRIENIGEINYQYIEFTVTTDVDTYSFTASSIHKGFTVTVLEKGKKTMTADENIKSAELKTCAKYITEPSLLENKVELYESRGVLNIRNISDKDITNAVVYYKQTDENGFFGGITFRTTLDSIKSGEIKQFNSEHFDKVVNIIYEQ